MTFGVLRRKALIQMIVSRNHEIDVRRVQQIPELLHLVLAAVQSRAVAGMMEIRDGALLAVRREIGREPFALRDVTGASAALVRRGRRRLRTWAYRSLSVSGRLVRRARLDR